jgi:hypothetical protein
LATKHTVDDDEFFSVGHEFNTNGDSDSNIEEKDDACHED